MTGSVAGRPLIIDAGPTLTFLAAGHGQLLVDVITRRGNRLLAPDAVIDEVARKASTQARFRSCDAQFDRLVEAGTVEQLSDSVDDQELAREVLRITGLAAEVRIGKSKDLGETMVIAHALKQQAAGVEVRVFIDEWRGQRLAQDHGLRVVSTEMVLAGAIDLSLIADRGEMRKMYETLRSFDDGLVHIDQTSLLEKGRYRRAKEAAVSADDAQSS